MWNNTQTRQWDQFFRLLEGKLTDRCLKLSLTEGGERAAPRIGTQEPVATTEKVMYARGQKLAGGLEISTDALDKPVTETFDAPVKFIYRS